MDMQIDGGQTDRQTDRQADRQTDRISTYALRQIPGYVKSSEELGN